MRQHSIETVDWVRTRLWPDFVERDGCVFVAFQVDESTTGPDSGTRTDWELFVNHTHMFDEFQSLAYEELAEEGASADPDVVEPKIQEDHPDFMLAKQLGEAMARMWATKLKQDYPRERFRVYYLHYDLACLRFHKVRPEEGIWLTDHQFLNVEDQDFRDGVLYDTDYLDRPVRRLDSKSASIIRKCPLRFGQLKGKIKIADDFDAPLPLEVLAAFEGEPEE